MRLYKQNRIELSYNRKTGEAATIDVAKGCNGCELSIAPCYAAKMAKISGVDFFTPVHQILDKKLLSTQLARYTGNWIRIGCISDPSLDWNKTLDLCKLIKDHGKIPVVVTKLHNYIPDGEVREQLYNLCQLQVSVSGLMNKRQYWQRLREIYLWGKISKNVVMRINSGWFKENSHEVEIQNELVKLAREDNIPTLETPIRLFRTSLLWDLVDQSKYHRHISPMSGKKDSQYTAGLILPNCYPCFSTCSPIPTEHDLVGCPHQCCTIRS